MPGPEAIRARHSTTPDRLASVGTGIPPDILQEASRRVGIGAIAMAAVWVVGLILVFVVAPLVVPDKLADKPGNDFAIHGAIALGLSLILFVLSRNRRIPPARLLKIALSYEVLITAVIAHSAHVTGWKEDVPLTSQGVSFIAIVILFFSVLVPSTRKRTLMAALLAGAMDPIFYYVGNASSPDRLPLAAVLLHFFPNWIAVGLAVLNCHVLNRLGRKISSARELGAYQLTGLLGEGGMGEVWRAEHRMLARPAAVKLIRAESLGNPSTAHVTLNRFEREAQATAALRSPHTVELYDYGMTDQGVFYYVMELLDGCDLQTLVQRYGSLPAERVVHILSDVCRSLEEAHASGLVHRDIKPANIFVSRLGLEYDYVKVLDFGLVKSERGIGDDTLRTAVGTIGGTPAYLAPEMASAKKRVDGRADLYALGCVGYWLLTEQLVFDDEDPMTLIVQHLQEIPVAPAARTEMSVPPELDRIILDCLAKDPDDRPQSAGALIERLEAVPLDRPWTETRAREWWSTHEPKPQSDAAPMREPTILLTAAGSDRMR